MALGQRARIAFTMSNACSLTVTVNNPGPLSPLIQLVVNGVIIGEYSSPTSVEIPFVQGLNVLQLCVADGAISFAGKVLGSLGQWASLYTQGNDLVNVSSASTAASPTTPT